MTTLKFDPTLRDRMIAHNDETPDERTASVLSAVACDLAAIGHHTDRMATALERIADALPTALALTDCIRRIQALEVEQDQERKALALQGRTLCKHYGMIVETNAGFGDLFGQLLDVERRIA